MAGWLALAAGSGCSKEASENDVEEESIAVNAALGQNEAYDALEVAYEAEVGFKRTHQTVVLDSTRQCFRFTDDEVNHLLTLDFGTPGRCSLSIFPFNRIRSGEDFGDVHRDRRYARRPHHYVRFVRCRQQENFRNCQIAEYHRDSLGLLQGTCAFSNFAVAFPDGTSATFNGSQTRVWSSGAGDKSPNNNIYEITGSLTGTSQSNRAFTADITQPVLANFSCPSFPRDQGTVELSALSGYPVREKDG